MDADGLLIEGLSRAEWANMEPEDLQTLIFCGRPVVFHVGSATILAEFTREESNATVVLAHIDGGGEGVLLTVFQLVRRLARKLAISRIEWVVAAVHCARPNLKLRETLVSLGFEVRSMPLHGDVYYRDLAVT